MKRCLSLISCCLLLLSLMIPVHAEDEYDELRRQIIESVTIGQPLDVSAYGLTRDELQEIYQDMLHRGLFPWYVDSYVDWSSGPDGTITAMIPRDMRDRGFDEDLYERSIAELIAATCHEGMTQEQMVLSVHDYIVVHTQYSYLGTVNNGYHALVKGETACYGYAQLFMRVMERLDIPCKIVICDDTGDGVGHAWNVVNLNGNWYHLDLTWDDPTMDVNGRVMHNHFLKTDRQFKSKSNGHTFDWETDVECNDRTYASGLYWDQVMSPIVFADGQTAYYCINNAAGVFIFEKDLATGKDTQLYWMEQPAVMLSGNYYYCRSYGLNVRGDRIWFNTPEAVYSVTTAGLDLRTEYTCETLKQGVILHGFYVEQNTLYLTFSDIDGNVTKKQIELTDNIDHIHRYETKIVEATCTENGYLHHCCDCGVTYDTKPTEPLGHELIQETAGSNRQICQNCDYFIEEITQTEPAQPRESPSPRPECKSWFHHALPVILPVCICVVVTCILVPILVTKKKRK